MGSTDLTLLMDLVDLLREVEGADITVEDLVAFRDELTSAGLLPDDSSSTAALVEAFMTLGKYDHGFGVQREQWADNSDEFNCSFLVYDSEGKKLSDRDPKFSRRMKLEDAIIKADQLKREFDAHKVLVVDTPTNSMLARLTTKGPKELTVNLKPFGT